MIHSMYSQVSPRVTEEQRRGALSVIGNQPREHWTELVLILGLKDPGEIDPPVITLENMER